MNFFPLEIASEDPKNTDLCGQKKHLFFAKLLLEFRKKHKRSSDITVEDSEEMLNIATSEYFRNMFEQEFGTEFDKEVTLPIIKKFTRSLGAELITMTSIIGGIVASEALKLTGKYTPIDQWFGYDQVKFLPDDVETLDIDSRYYDNSCIFGKQAQTDLSKLKVFLPGAGAIG